MLRPAEDRSAINSENAIPLLESRLLGETGRRNAPHYGIKVLGAQDADDPIEDHSQDKVGRRTRSHNQHAAGETFSVEGLMPLCGRYLSLAFIEHFHVPAERDQTNDILSGVRPFLASPYRSPEAY